MVAIFSISNQIDMTDKTKIGNSFYAYAFEDISGSNIFQLSENLSETIWSEYIDKKADTYFHLSEDNWLINSGERSVVSWFEDFRGGNPSNVGNALKMAVSWSDEDIIWYCINKSSIIECFWREFQAFWIDFLCAHNDAPIIINGKYKLCGFVFYSSEVVFVGGC